MPRASCRAPPFPESNGGARRPPPRARHEVVVVDGLLRLNRDRVCWVETEHPRELEAELIRTLVLPLNLDQNTHTFCATLREIRQAARTRARDTRDTRV